MFRIQPQPKDQCFGAGLISVISSIQLFWGKKFPAPAPQLRLQLRLKTLKSSDFSSGLTRLEFLCCSYVETRCCGLKHIGIISRFVSISVERLQWPALKKIWRTYLVNRKKHEIYSICKNHGTIAIVPSLEGYSRGWTISPLFFQAQFVSFSQLPMEW